MISTSKALFPVILLILSVILFSASVQGQTCTADPAGRLADSLQLINLRTSTYGYSWVNKWDTSKPINTWYGVLMTSNGCRVRSISMTNNHVTGSLPSELDLPELTTLKIINAASALGRLSGRLPDMTKLPQLRSLELTRNNISDTLPKIFSDSLRILTLSYNQIYDTIPVYTNLSRLTEVRLNNNLLEGNVPDYSSNPMLAVLDLSANQLSGHIPLFEGNDSLNYIALNNNALTDTIPDFNLGKLKELYLYSNQLSGKLPLFNNTVLERIYLHLNQISDTVPNYTNSSIRSLFLHSNPLYGTLPDFDALVNLTDLRIYATQVEGYLPLFTNNRKLVAVYLSENNLYGPIPDYTLPDLQNLRINENNLTGELRNFDLPSMTIFFAHGNKLSGTLPVFNRMPKLTQLLISNNLLCGPLPEGIDLPQMALMSLADNFFSGEVSASFIAGMPKLADLRLENNDFHGPVPDFNSTTLYRLYFHYNRFSGSLPGFNNALKLKEILGSHNLLSGNIPDYKARPGSDTTNMYLDFSKNNFNFSHISTSPYNTVNRYSYRSQIIPLNYDPATRTLSVYAGYVNNESENTYVWKKTCAGVVETLPENTRTLVLPEIPDGCRYRCEISNTILTQDHTIALSSALNSTYKKLTIGSHIFTYRPTPASLCKYEQGTLECEDVLAGTISLPVKYKGDTSFIKGITPLQISYPEEYVQADSFRTVSETVGAVAYLSDEDGLSALELPDFSSELIPFPNNTAVPLGKGEFSVLSDNFNATSSFDLNDIVLNTQCSDCAELEADFIYFYSEPECLLSMYDTITGTVIISFRYVDYRHNTALPQLKIWFRTDYAVDTYSQVPENDIVYADGRYLVTFVLPATAISSGRMKYKIEAVSESGRYFRLISDYYIDQRRDEPLLCYTGTAPDRFDVIENLKHPSCDMYWYIFFKRPVVYTLNGYVGVLKINNVQQYNAYMTESQVDDGWGYRTNSIVKGNLKVPQLPACYRLDASYTGTIGYLKSMIIDYKIMCKSR